MVFFAAILLAAQLVLACSCGSSLEEQAADATVVVDATVVEVDLEGRTHPMRLRVHSVYKGVATVGQELDASWRPCNDGLSAGRRFIWFLRERGGTLTWSLCFGLSATDEAGSRRVQDAVDFAARRDAAIAALGARPLTPDDTLQALAWGASSRRATAETDAGCAPTAPPTGPSEVFGVPMAPGRRFSPSDPRALGETPHAALVAIGAALAPRLVAAEAGPDKRPFAWLSREERERLPREFEALDLRLPGGGARAYDRLLALPPGRSGDGMFRAVCDAVIGEDGACADASYGSAPPWIPARACAP